MGPGNSRRAVRAARRLTPLVIAGYRRWENLSPKEKERYKRQALRYAEQSRDYARVVIAKVPRGRFRRGR
jgi:hypothetical protein